MHQEAPGEPSWVNTVDWHPELTDTWPITFRDVDRTPEGDPVTMMMGRENEGISRLDMMDPELIVRSSAELMSAVIDKDWMRDVWDQGNEVFTEQSPDRDDFWNTVPLTGNKPGYYSKPISFAEAVESYGDWGYLESNDYIRRGYPNTLEEMRRGMQTVRDIDSSNPYTQRKRSLDRFRAREDVERAVRNCDTARTLIATLDTAMRPAPRNIFVRRGFGEDVSERMQQELRVGDRFTDECFTSSSITPTFNWSRNNMANIIVTEGTPVLWTNGHARKGEKENELIIGRGVTYEVVSTDNERGWILRTIPPKGRYRAPRIPDPIPQSARRFLQTVPQNDPDLQSAYERSLKP